jgi:hypothetical protein
VGEILAQMVQDKCIGQTWLSDKEYRDKLKRKR